MDLLVFVLCAAATWNLIGATFPAIRPFTNGGRAFWSDRVPTTLALCASAAFGFTLALWRFATNTWPNGFRLLLPVAVLAGILFLVFGFRTESLRHARRKQQKSPQPR